MNDDDVLETVTVDRHGITWQVDIVADYDSKLTGNSVAPFGPYTLADSVAWHQGTWRYVGVIVTAQIPGAQLIHPEHGPIAVTPSASLWSVEYGQLGDKKITGDLLARGYPAVDLMDDVVAQIQQLHKALALLPVTATGAIG